jgi:Domain of Unknown Function (DUF1259)
MSQNRSDRLSVAYSVSYRRASGKDIFALLAFIAGLVTLTLLRANLAIVTALHSHMIDDSPHLFFMHFWANDDVTKLTHGLRAALDLANIKHGT